MEDQELPVDAYDRIWGLKLEARRTHVRAFVAGAREQFEHAETLRSDGREDEVRGCYETALNKINSSRELTEQYYLPADQEEMDRIANNCWKRLIELEAAKHTGADPE